MNKDPRTFIILLSLVSGCRSTPTEVPREIPIRLPVQTPALSFGMPLEKASTDVDARPAKPHPRLAVLNIKAGSEEGITFSVGGTFLDEKLLSLTVLAVESPGEAAKVDGVLEKRASFQQKCELLYGKPLRTELVDRSGTKGKEKWSRVLWHHEEYDAELMIPTSKGDPNSIDFVAGLNLMLSKRHLASKAGKDIEGLIPGLAEGDESASDHR